MTKRKIKFRAAAPLSTLLFLNLHDLYFNELRKTLESDKGRNGFHCYTLHGISAFPIAGAVWEAILNEKFTYESTEFIYKNNLLFDIIEIADKWDVKTKTEMFPKFLFGRTFNISNALYSNFASLIQIRNNIVHYKHSAYEGPDKALKNLRSQKVTYPKPDTIDCPWSMELSSSECIRFCINTISDLVKELSNLETPYYKHNCIPITTQIYSSISDERVMEEFSKYNINPTSINNDIFRVKIGVN